MTTTIPFGPQLVGETEKTLNALLRRALEGTGLSESQWVALRVASLVDGLTSSTELVAAVSDRAHFGDAAELVRALDERGLTADGRVTAAGRETLTSVLARSAAITGPIWEGYAPADLDAATAVLNQLLARARDVLAGAAAS